MEGHVRHQANGRWYATLEIARDPETGSRRRRGLGGYATKAEAREALRHALEEGRRGWRGPERLSVAEYLREWLDGVELSRAPTTAALYRTLLEHHVIPRIGGERLQRLSASTLTKMYTELLRHGGPGGRALSPKSVRNVATTVRKALGDAVDARRLDWNPAAAAKLPKIRAETDRIMWTSDQVATFLRHVADDRLAALYVVAATTGLRRSELLALRWADLELEREDRARLHVRRALVQYGRLVVEKEPKSARSRRTIALDPAAVLALRRHRAAQARDKMAERQTYTDNGLVFCDVIGRTLRPDALSAGFSRLVADAALPPIGLHGLRHSWATLALEAGIDTVYVSAVLGHSTPAITANVYQHARPERLDQAVLQVGNAIFGRR
ncbi:MAG: site-specific integrase [Actinomycetota bacterium]|nr:site-specific integrase [Actinomycetota bacterium]